MNPTTTTQLRAYDVCRNSRLNQRGHEIRYATEHLLFLIRELKASSAKRKLAATLKHAEHDLADCTMVDDLMRLIPDAAGVAWTLEMFLGELKTILVPTQEQKREMQAEFLREHSDTETCRRKPR